MLLSIRGTRKTKKIIVKQEQQGNVPQHSGADKVLMTQNQKKALRAKVHMAKAMAESANVTTGRKLGEIDTHEKNLKHLLEKFRHVLGEDVHKARVQELFSSMPSPTLFVDKNAVICIDIDDDDVNCEKQDASEEVLMHG